MSVIIPVDRQASAHMPVFPPACEAPPPRLLAPPPGPADPTAKTPKTDVRMELENASLWKQFSSVGTEMIDRAALTSRVTLG